ncbi:MAG: hypothetical protein ACJ76Y_22555 [Thermoanaerobaculia bacterium]
MNRTRFALSLLLTSVWLGATAHPASAAQLVPLDFEEELYADVFANPPVVASQPGGPYVIAWDDDTFATNEGSFTYRYTPAGENPAGIDHGTGYHSIYSPTGAPDVDSITAGREGFDVIWHAFEYEGPAYFYRAHLNLRGQSEGKPVRLGNAFTEWAWQVKGNGFMAGWPLPSKHGIAARRLTASGQWTGPELRLNSRLVDQPAYVSVVGLADASFVAVWLGSAPGSPKTAVLRARRFSPSGKPLGADFDVNSFPLGLYDPSSGYGPALKVAAAPGGGFVVAWGLTQGAYLRWFNASGIPLGPERRASAAEDFFAFPQDMAFDDTGDLVLLWSLGYDGLQIRLFDPQGTPQGPPVDVNSDVNEDPWGRSMPWGGGLAWTGDSWLVAWVASIFPYDQGTIFVRRFAKR